ncbi:MAG: hypothetical protein NNA30_11515 [Nitrospira sp.]|nr:hypothetical protein [Nitrospira sp.]
MGLNGHLENPNHPVNRLTGWFTSLGFNNALLLMVFAAMVGIPTYYTPIIVDSIQKGTERAAVEAARVGAEALKRSEESHERTVKIVTEAFREDKERMARMIDRLVRLEESADKKTIDRAP